MADRDGPSVVAAHAGQCLAPQKPMQPWGVRCIGCTYGATALTQGAAAEALVDHVGWAHVVPRPPVREA